MRSRFRVPSFLLCLLVVCSIFSLQVAAGDLMQDANSAEYNDLKNSEIQVSDSAEDQEFEQRTIATDSTLSTSSEVSNSTVVDAKLYGWVLSNGKYYFYDLKTGEMKTGWLQWKDQWYFLDDDGTMVANGWRYIDGNKYHFNANGSMSRRGWQYIDDRWYFFYDGGSLLTDGWRKSGGYWYYLDIQGKMATSTYINSRGKTYFLFQDGKMATGWLKINDVWNYFDANGALVQNGWAKTQDGKNWLYLNEKGVVVKDSWLERNNYRYLLDRDGIMQTGWRYLDNHWIYFRSSGSQVTDGWAKGNGGRKWYYLGSDGVMLSNQILNVNNQTYYLTADGSMFTGWLLLNGKWAYFKPNGALHRTGWVKDTDGYWYLMDEYGDMIYDKFVQIGDRTYLFGKSGRMQTGWEKYKNKWYFFDRSSGAMYKGMKSVGNLDYYFDPNDGHLRSDTNGYWKIADGKIITTDNKQINIGNKAIIVSIQDQTMWGYDNGSLFSTKVTTGASGMDTPKGIHRIRSKSRNTYLGGVGYYVHVNYWMDFAYGGYGIHDASWRSVYGTMNYIYNGSHGCINTPPSVMGKFYNTFPTGTVVFIY